MTDEIQPESLANETTAAAAQPKQRTGLIIGGILLVALLAAAAFMAGRLLTQQANLTAGELNLPEFVSAPEIPTTEPELNGMVDSLDGDNLIVQTFSMNDTMGMQSSGGGVMIIGSEGEALPPPETSTGGDVVAGAPSFQFEIGGEAGPKVEVVITHATKVYRDTTYQNAAPMVFSSSDGPVQSMPEMPERIEQTVEAVDPAEIGPGTMVTVWGERRGDQVIAEVILFSAPISISVEGQVP